MQLTWVHNQALLVLFTFDNNRNDTLNCTCEPSKHEHHNALRMDTLRRNRCDSRRLDRAPRHSTELGGKLAVHRRSPRGRRRGSSRRTWPGRSCSPPPRRRRRPWRPHASAAAPSSARGASTRRGRGAAARGAAGARTRGGGGAAAAPGGGGGARRGPRASRARRWRRRRRDGERGGCEGKGAGDERVATRPRTLSLSPPSFCLPPCGVLNREILLPPCLTLGFWDATIRI